MPGARTPFSAGVRVASMLQPARLGVGLCALACFGVERLCLLTFLCAFAGAAASTGARAAAGAEASGAAGIADAAGTAGVAGVA